MAALPVNPTFREFRSIVRSDDAYPPGPRAVQKRILRMVGRVGLERMLHPSPPEQTGRLAADEYGSVEARVLADLQKRAGRNEAGIAGVDFAKLTKGAVKKARTWFNLEEGFFSGGTVNTLFYTASEDTDTAADMRDRREEAITTAPSFYAGSPELSRKSNRGSSTSGLRDRKGRDLGGAQVVFPDEAYGAMRRAFDETFPDKEHEIVPSEVSIVLSTFWHAHAPRGNSSEAEEDVIAYFQKRLAQQRWERWLREQLVTVQTFRRALERSDKVKMDPIGGENEEGEGGSGGGKKKAGGGGGSEAAGGGGGEAEDGWPVVPPILQAPAPPFVCDPAVVAHLAYEQGQLGSLSPAARKQGMYTFLAAVFDNASTVLTGEDKGGEGEEDDDDEDEEKNVISSTPTYGAKASSTSRASRSPSTPGFTQSQTSQYDEDQGLAMSRIGASEGGHELHLSIGTATTGANRGGAWGVGAAERKKTSSKKGSGATERASSSGGAIVARRRVEKSSDLAQRDCLGEVLAGVLFAANAPLRAAMSEAMLTNPMCEPFATEIVERFVRNLARPVQALMDDLFSRARVSEPDFVRYIHTPVAAFVAQYLLPVLEQSGSLTDFVGSAARYKVMQSILGQRYSAEAAESTTVIKAGVFPGARIPVSLALEVALSSKPLTNLMKKAYGNSLIRARAVLLCDGNLVGNSVLLGDFATCAYWVKLLGTGYLATWRRLPQLIGLTPGGDGHDDIALHAAINTSAEQKLGVVKDIPSPHSKYGTIDIDICLQGGDGKYLQELLAARPYVTPERERERATDRHTCRWRERVRLTKKRNTQSQRAQNKTTTTIHH